ncbi:MAG: hypothetical protein WBQ86_05855 [Candidatus Binatus sp.]
MLGDLLQRASDCASNIQPCPFCDRSRTAVSSTESDRTGYLACKKIYLRLDFSRALLVAPFAAILQLLSELYEPPFVAVLRLGVQHLARIAQPSNADIRTLKYRIFVDIRVLTDDWRSGPAYQIKRMEFLARML